VLHGLLFLQLQLQIGNLVVQVQRILRGLDFGSLRFQCSLLRLQYGL
jgi:hypothetical protein